MEPIIAGHDLRKSWGSTLVLENADFLIHAGEKVALVGPNGAGKSTLFRLIAGETSLDVLGVSEELLDQTFGSLSGGEKSKVLTARALANAKEKDILLLDEPTNHMDVDTIETIEEFLLEIDAALLLASHDKFLLDAIAHKVLEVDHLRILEYDGNYTDYRVQRDALARAREAQRNRHMKEMKRQLAIIEEFKARKVYEQVLSRKLLVEKMRRATPEPGPSAAHAVRLAFNTGGSGHGIGRREGIAEGPSGRLLFAEVDFELGKGDKVGLVGPNGAGKTTLLEILIGQQEPDAGSVHRR